MSQVNVVLWVFQIVSREILCNNHEWSEREQLWVQSREHASQHLQAASVSWVWMQGRQTRTQFCWEYLNSQISVRCQCVETSITTSYVGKNLVGSQHIFSGRREQDHCKTKRQIPSQVRYRISRASSVEPISHQTHSLWNADQINDANIKRTTHF